MKTKIIIIFLTTFIIFIIYRIIHTDLGKKTDNNQPGEIIIYYNNDIYDRILNWWPTGNVGNSGNAWFGYSSEIPEIDRVKNNSKIWLYDNDPDNIFIIKNYKSWLYDELIFHKRDDELPKPYFENSTILLELNSRSDVFIETKILSEFKEFIENCLTDHDNVLKSDGMNNIFATIKIFYEDYPAYNYFEHIGTSNGKIVLRPLTSSDKYTYFIIPDNISEYFKQFISYQQN